MESRQAPPEPEGGVGGLAATTYLGEGGLRAAAKVRRGVAQQRLDLLGDDVDERGGDALGLGVRLGAVDFEDERVGLVKVGVGEEADARAGEGALLGAGGRQQVRRVGVGEELAHDGGLGDDFAVVRERRHQAARVDLEVLLRARDGEVDDLLLVGQAELDEGDVRTVSPFWLGG
ncbi:hypothetical protein Cob_v007763 [Colletotrichum orbiculare MAFF 240422]|uniref:Uncharacterized protein n=1 Tax=Colletotrichum orbiculare (strain 104-T / ATCC 96160 / CBS 514.97 / LARS 414 / MAFF 240422) TaxID=1213857 RepID=A0A484FLX1_COLOR|nr:hypothetical protein Cob_v007763 [Colletotrichum orbiculare MAFF 240422]